MMLPFTDLNPAFDATILGTPRKVKRTFRAAWLLWLMVPVLIWWALKDIPLAEVWTSLRQLSLGSLGILVVLNVTILVLVSLRWWVILRGMGWNLALGEIFRYRLASFGVSYFTPGPQIGGEYLQVHLLRGKHAIPVATAISSVFLDKLIELLANFTFLVIGLVTIGLTGLASKWLGNGLWVLIMTLLLLPGLHLAALWNRFYPMTWLLKWITQRRPRNGWVQKLTEVVFQAEEQIAVLCRERPMDLLLVSIISVVSLVLMLVEYGLLLTFIHLDVSIPQVVIGLTATRIAFLAPLPGGLGVLEASQVMVMNALGMPPAAGITASLIMRGRDLLVGGLGLWLSSWRGNYGNQLKEGEKV